MKRFSNSGSVFTQWEGSLSYPASLAGSIEPFTFAIIADSHCEETPSSLRHSRGLEHLGDGVNRLRLCFDAIRSMDESEKPAFLFLLGDIGIEAAEPVLVDAPCPIHAIAGNHDWGPGRHRLRELFPVDFGFSKQASDYYTFQHGGIHFVAICNAGIGNEHTGQLASEDIRPPGQASWLAEQFAIPAEFKVLFGHCPPESKGFVVQEYLRTASYKYLPFMGECDSHFLNDLLISNGPIAAFFGHLHRATHSYAAGSSRVHVLRSCNWNHEEQPIGFTHVRIDESELPVREILVGSYRHDS